MTQILAKSSTQTVLSDKQVRIDDIYLSYHIMSYPILPYLWTFVQIISRSKEFVADVMGDDMLQKEGGDALWKSVSHALKPGLTR